MIKQPFFRFAAVVSILTTLTIFSQLATTAQAATKPSCTVVDVILHGTAAPTATCRATTVKYPSNVGRVLPNANGDFCGTNTDALALYWNSPIGVTPNHLLCVYGPGLLNLNQTFPDGLNWNDQASAWWTGCYDVYFYTDINRGGSWAFARGSTLGQSSPSGIFPYNSNSGGGTVGNDKLSSVYQVGGSNFC